MRVKCLMLSIQRAGSVRRRATFTAVSKQVIAVFCAALMAYPASAAPAGEAAAKELEIVALQGDNATHLVNYHRHEHPVVLVRAGGLPVKGAAVTFELPATGPSGIFAVPEAGAPRDMKVFHTRTDKRGRAAARGFEPNKEVGEYVIRVAATHNDQVAKLELKQRNIWSKTAQADSRKLRNTFLFGAVIIAAVLVVVVVVANRSWN